jgi:predicted DNA-binding transcriptional regulator YafY
VSRIVSARALDEHFERPSDFDLAAYWERSSATFEASFQRIDVQARVSPQGLRQLRHALEPQSARDAIATAGPPDVEGWVEVTIGVEDLGYAHDDLLRLGADCEVLAPLELRSQLMATAGAMGARYRSAWPSQSTAVRAPKTC